MFLSKNASYFNISSKYMKQKLIIIKIDREYWILNIDVKVIYSQH